MSVLTRKSTIWLATLPVFALALLFGQKAEQASAQRYVDDVKVLAAPEMEGRGAGTKGSERASKYIADRFKEVKLQPAGENKSYWQTFQVTTGAKPGTENHLGKLKLDTDYTPLSFSSNGQVTAPVVFAGHGITAPEFHHDDYSHLDVKDKIVLVLRYEPKEFQKDKDAKERIYTHHSSLVSKAINARNHGAKAVILANGTVDPSHQDTLIRFGTISGPENVGILMAQVKNSVADEWIKELKAGKPLELAMRVDIKREQADVRNVVGYLPGQSNEYIVIGAHYDHLGFGNESSLAPSQIGKVHAGADDNASGTAGLLELARLFAGRKGDLKRGVLFIAFAGEEIGLLGSSQWVNHPTLPIENAAAMLNMDMIGRVNGSKLFIGGTGTGSTFDEMLKKTVANYDFKVDYSEDGFSASDHTSFTAKSVPVLFFFSGLHGDYHKPSDTWEKINGPASAKVVNLVYDVASNLVASDARPKFQKVEPRGGPHSVAPPSGGGGGGYGPYFGSIPDFAPVEKGVKFSDVRAGSPAGKAGLKAGDILIGFGDKPINNLYDFTYALRNSKVGDVVTVKFIRDGKEMTAPVTLEARR
ncbi:MAG TPA: M20/M25/M40 family metallo-hydrolase [Bryobacteraceae bacterium]|nr:M20/M25/M40 family metallo-hydrolase [Bryobacteraceae bacterium]